MEYNNSHIPICIIGVGGIVADAHLGGFEVKGIVNRNKQKAIALAEKFKIAKVYDTIGVPDIFEYVLLDDQNREWKKKNIDGTWFPHAFIGTMQQMMLAKAGIVEKPENNTDDTLMTMACVEAAYASNQIGGILIDDFL